MEDISKFINIQQGWACCYVKQNPDILTTELLNDLGKWKLVFRALLDAVTNHEKDCVQAILVQYGQSDALKAGGNYLVDSLIDEATEGGWTEAKTVLNIFIEYGASSKYSMIQLYPILRHDRRLNGMYNLCLKKVSRDLIPLLVRGAANHMLAFGEDRIYSENALNGAILSGNTEFLYLLRLTGTTSENMMEAIKRAHSSAQIGRTQLAPLKEVPRRMLSLKEANRIAIWKTLSNKEDIEKLILPTLLKKFLLFDDTDYSLVQQ